MDVCYCIIMGMSSRQLRSCRASTQHWDVMESIENVLNLMHHHKPSKAYMNNLFLCRLTVACRESKTD